LISRKIDDIIIEEPEEVKKVLKDKKDIKTPRKSMKKDIKKSSWIIASPEKRKQSIKEKKIDTEELLSILETGKSASEKREALLLLRGVSDKRVAPVIGKILLEDSDSGLKILAAELMASLSDRRVLNILLESMKKEKEPQVRKKVAWAYSKLKYTK